jgi:hypothetical protein
LLGDIAQEERELLTPEVIRDDRAEHGMRHAGSLGRRSP